MQEALSNALQHAQATALHVTLEQRQDTWHLRVQDDGVGLTPRGSAPMAGNGLQGMAYRAARAGAHMEHGPGLEGRGVGVHVYWTLPPPRR
ncbi:sensory histidine kinase UhpB [compost metagenome]